jgi:hypothetical protein
LRETQQRLSVKLRRRHDDDDHADSHIDLHQLQLLARPYDPNG